MRKIPGWQTLGCFFLGLQSFSLSRRLDTGDEPRYDIEQNHMQPCRPTV
jgi:hypothetical protein